MKPTIIPTALGALLGASLHLQAAPTLVPNGDFETPAGATWAEVNGDGAAFAYSYPAADGNPGGYGFIDNTVGGSWGIWVANGDATITPASLGLTAGEAYLFSQDMTILSGATIGGFKVDFFTGTTFIGSTGDMFPTLIGDGTTWETYTFEVVIPAAADGIKVVPLWGAGSSIGYDNVGVDPTPIPQPPLPNGDFENGSANWFELGAPNTTHSYPASGGNPDGHAVMTNDGGGFGIWVANGGAPLALDSLGLAGGEVVTFTQDMTILSGTNLGGLKIEFLEGATFLGDTGDMFPTLIGDGSTWETYSFDVAIPGNADNIKVVPLWGSGSSVGYDNVSFIQPVPTIFAAEIKTGTLVSWTASSPDNTYQAQESPDNSTWTDLGSAITGDTVTSAFDADGAPFHQVVETTPDILDESFFNPGFEDTESAIYPSPGALDWTIQSPEDTDPLDGTATMTVQSSYSTFSPRSGSQMLVIESTTPATGAVSPPNTNVASTFLFVEENTTYDLSFHAAHVVKNGGANPQFNIRFYDDLNGYLGETGFESIASIESDWTRVEKTFTTPASSFWMTIEWIQAMGAGNGWQWVTLIDDVSLPYVDTPGSASAIAATPAPGIGLCWPTKAGMTYQVRSGTDLSSPLADFGPAIAGDGNTWTATDLITLVPTFYEVVQSETP